MIISRHHLTTSSWSYSSGYHLSTTSCFFSWIVLAIGHLVTIFSWSYVETFDCHLFFLIICYFHVGMMLLSCCDDHLLAIFLWELLGITSYLLLNFWSNKIHCGIMAVAYNRLGDFLLLLSIILSHHILLCLEIGFVILFMCYYLIHYQILLPSLLIIISTKSAQGCVVGRLPFSSWLVYAMSAPTPVVSSLLHSSTMVIAGLYLSILLSLHFNVTTLLTLFDFHFPQPLPIPLLVGLLTSLWSSHLALFTADIKSIVAFSTIGQLAYINLCLFHNPLTGLSHIIIHSCYKCLLFLLAAEIIHTLQSSHQSSSNLTITNSLLRSLFLMSGSALLFSSSKESLLHASTHSSSHHHLISTTSSLLSLLYLLVILLPLLTDSRILLTLPLLAFPLLSLSILLADKSLRHLILTADHPLSLPLLLSSHLNTASSAIPLLLPILLASHLSILSIHHLTQSSIISSFPLSSWSPSSVVSHLPSTDFCRLPLLVFDSFGRFRAIVGMLFRPEALLVFLPIFLLSL